MDSDGSNHRVLHSTAYADLHYPHWHPDGTKLIAYGGNGSELWNVYLDGSVPTKLGVTGSDPDWHPDGTKFIVSGLKIHYLDGSDHTNLGGHRT